MKKNIIITAFVIVANILAFTLTANAQNNKPLVIGDETTISYIKNDAKIECDNEAIFMKIMKTHEQLFKRFTCSWKTDRHGLYKHYVIYINKADANIIIEWAKTHL